MGRQFFERRERSCQSEIDALGLTEKLSKEGFLVWFRGDSLLARCHLKDFMLNQVFCDPKIAGLKECVYGHILSTRKEV